MMKKFKIIILFIVIVIIFFISFKIYLSRKYPQDFVKDFIISIIKNEFKKAIKFDHIYINSFGNIIINNLHVSNSSDFNDNISLLTSKETEINLNLINLVRNKFIINYITFNDVNINFLKQYGKSYSDSLKLDILLKKNNKLRKFISDSFKIYINKGKLNYKEIFKKEDIHIELGDLFLDLYVKDKTIKFVLNGDVKQYKSSELDTGRFNCRGYIFSNNDNKISIKLKNIDLTYINPYIKNLFNINYYISGIINTDLKISYKNEYNINGNLNFINLNLINNNDNRYLIISHENSKIDIDCKLNKELNNIKIKNLKFNDDNIIIESNLEYYKNKNHNKFKLYCKSNSIDLDVISKYFTPLNNITYGGKFTFSTKLDLDLNNSINSQVLFTYNLSDFWANKAINGNKIKIIKETNSNLNINSNKISFFIKGLHKKSDFKINLNSSIKSWLPLKSDSKIKISSNYLDINIIKKIFYMFLERLYIKIYQDKKLGYNEIFFRQKPFGKFIINNDFNLNVDINKLGITEKAYLTSLNLDMNLKYGNLKTDKFELSGYNGKYNFNFDAKMNRDYPVVNINANIHDMDLNFINNSSGSFNLGLEYKCSAYRLKHLVDNAQARIFMNVGNAYFHNLQVLNDANKFFNDLGYITNLKNLNVSNASIEFKESGDNYYIRNFSFNSDKIHFNSYGKYNYFKGLKVPINFILLSYNNKNENIPIILMGKLKAPEIYSKKSNKKMVLYNIN